MLPKPFVVSAARKLCLSWTGTVSKPGVTQMTSWPGWASGTDLSDLGAGRLIRLWPCCAPAAYTTTGEDSMVNTWPQAGRRLHYIIYEDVLLGCPGGGDALSLCLWWYGYEWQNDMLPCLCLLSQNDLKFAQLVQLRAINAKVLG